LGVPLCYECRLVLSPLSFPVSPSRPTCDQRSAEASSLRSFVVRIYAPLLIPSRIYISRISVCALKPRTDPPLAPPFFFDSPPSIFSPFRDVFFF